MGGLISSKRLLFTQAAVWLEGQDSRAARGLRHRLEELLEVERVAATFPRIRFHAPHIRQQILDSTFGSPFSLGPLQLPTRALMLQSLRVARIQLLRVVRRALTSIGGAPEGLVGEVGASLSRALHGRIYDEVLVEAARSPDLGLRSRAEAAAELVRRWDLEPSSCGRFSDALSALWSTRDEHARAWKGFVDAALHTCPSLLTPVMDGHARAGAVRGALMDLYAGPRFPTAPGEAEGGLTAVDEDFACPSLALPLDPRGGGAEQAYRSFRLRQRALELGSLAKVHEGRGRREHPAETFLAVGLLSGERPAAARPEWRAAS